jgi:hypothetical protein
MLNELSIHFFNSQLDFFPENLVAVSEEQGEPSHQDIKEMERRYQSRWNGNMMTLHREIPETSHKRNSNLRSFAGKRKCQYKAIE